MKALEAEELFPQDDPRTNSQVEADAEIPWED